MFHLNLIRCYRLDIPTMTLIVQTCGVVGTLLAATIAVRSYVNSNKRAEDARARELETRQAQLFMNIFQTTTSKEWMTDTEEMIHIWKWRDFGDFDAKYGEISNSVATGKMNAALGYWNGVGVLVQKSLIDSQLIYDMKRFHVIELWDKFSPVILEWRRRYSAPQIYVSLEYLVGELKRIRDVRGDGVYVERSKVGQIEPQP
jgi:hypothetical protein